MASNNSMPACKIFVDWKSQAFAAYVRSLDKAACLNGGIGVLEYVGLAVIVVGVLDDGMDRR